eukprot:2620566-Alexandrium_andersonii.AAC.1
MENHLNETAQELKEHTTRASEEGATKALEAFFGAGSSSNTATSIEVHAVEAGGAREEGAGAQGGQGGR